MFLQGVFPGSIRFSMLLTNLIPSSHYLILTIITTLYVNEHLCVPLIQAQVWLITVSPAVSEIIYQLQNMELNFQIKLISFCVLHVQKPHCYDESIPVACCRTICHCTASTDIE